mgnify:CR=1 FL=1
MRFTCCTNTKQIELFGSIFNENVILCTVHIGKKPCFIYNDDRMKLDCKGDYYGNFKF